AGDESLAGGAGTLGEIAALPVCRLAPGGLPQRRAGQRGGLQPRSGAEEADRALCLWRGGVWPAARLAAALDARFRRAGGRHSVRMRGGGRVRRARAVLRWAVPAFAK